MLEDQPPARIACCDSDSACVFAKALLARSAGCELATRHALAERDVIDCTSPVARINCATLAELLHERARFALRLPRPGHPVMHVQALRLQCGGLQGIKQALGAAEADVHRMVGLVHQRHGSLTELPWPTIVGVMVTWQTRQTRQTRRPPPAGPR